MRFFAADQLSETRHENLRPERPDSFGSETDQRIKDPKKDVGFPTEGEEA